MAHSKGTILGIGCMTGVKSGDMYKTASPPREHFKGTKLSHIQMKIGEMNLVGALTRECHVGLRFPYEIRVIG